MGKRTRRSPARFLAPLALIAVVVAFMAIVTSSKNGGASTTDSVATTSTSASQTTTTKTSTTKKAATKTGTSVTVSTYTVQVGDTLGSIAAKTGVPLAQIQTLNPDVDPHAMVAGQKIKLK